MGTILVTGASGFLGKELIKQLLQKGDTVIGVDKNEFPNTALSNGNKFIFIKQYINENLLEVLNEYDIDFIYHLAAQLNNSSSLTFEDFYASNVLTTLCLTKLAKQKNTKVFLLASTCSIFGLINNDEVLDEESVPNPTDYYGLSKYISEKILLKELENYQTRAIIMRFTSIFGKDDKYGLVNTLFNLAKNSEDIELFSKGSKYRNLLYITDAVDVLTNILSRYGHLGQSEIFMVGSKDSITVKLIAENIVKLLNSQSRIILSEKIASFDNDSHINVKKAIDKLAFDPMTIETALTKYI